MSVDIRHYKQSDFPVVESWWAASGEAVPPSNWLPRHSTFLISVDNTLAACVSVYLTNSKELAYLENVVGNPDLKGPARRAALEALVRHAEAWTKRKGYKRLVLLGYRAPVKKRYLELGYKETLDGVSTFVKEL